MSTGNQNIEVKVEEGVKELVIRNGNAANIHEPKIVTITGTITAPGKFLEKRKNDHEDNKCHVLFSRHSMEINAIFSEDSQFSSKVTGKLELNPELAEYGINKNKTFNISDLRSFLRMRRAHFSDRDKAMKLIEHLSQFKANIQKEVVQHDDTRGNTKDNFESKVTSNLDLKFSLTMPIFKGQTAKKFGVEVCFDVSEREVKIWMESPELAEVILKDRDSIIDKEISLFKDYVVIEQ